MPWAKEALKDSMVNSAVNTKFDITPWRMTWLSQFNAYLMADKQVVFGLFYSALTPFYKGCLLTCFPRLASILALTAVVCVRRRFFLASMSFQSY